MSTKPRSDERVQFLADIITTAVEGGIGYWAATRNYRWTDPATAQVEVRDHADNKAPFVLVTPDTIENAIERIIKGEIKIAHRLQIEIATSNRDNDAGQIDAESADCILQVAALGDIIFG